jgi:hypothetical protein
MSGKLTRLVILLAGLGSVTPAVAGELKADEARRFVAGKMFAYNCFEGTSGAGRIFADGSVAGYVQIRGNGAPRYVVLPAGTLRVKGDQYCASLRGMPFEPCFYVEKTSHYSFRGAVSGLGFAYCDFNRRSARAEIARGPLRLRPFRSSAVLAGPGED